MSQWCVAAHQDKIQEVQGHRAANNIVCEVCCRKFRRESDTVNDKSFTVRKLLWFLQIFSKP